MTSGTIDLHTHTTYSDGMYTPRELTRLAAKKGLTAIAVTDHDTIDGVEEALLAGRECGVEVIPGVEISAKHSSGCLHILGYYVDCHNPSFLKFLRNYIDSRNRRNPLILTRLREMGYPLDMEEVAALAGGDVINRPHIAQAMVNRNYVQTRQEAFDRFLGQGASAFFAKEIYSAADTVRSIHEAGGLAVLAHPSLLNVGGLVKIGDEIRRLHAQAGFDGLEAYHGDSVYDHATFYAQIAKELSIFVTGGSDFHGDENHQSLGQTRCLSAIPYRFVEEMKSFL